MEVYIVTSGDYFGHVQRETPVYDYNTKEILLDKRERLIDAGLI